MTDWQDLRCVLAVSQHGGLKGAAKALGVDATTVSRRVSALERELGGKLYVRERGKWRTTGLGEVVTRRCEGMARQVRALRHDVDELSGSARGKVRLTTMGAVARNWLMPELATLAADHPGLSLELFVTVEEVDLVGGKADVALRMSRPRQAGLVVRRLATVGLCVAATPALAALPREDRGMILVGFEQTDSAENRAVRGHGGHVTFASTSFELAMDMVREGLGVGLLPKDEVGEGMVVLAEDAAEREIWRATPEEIARAPRIKAATDWLDGVFARR